jgi:hypothetical protein
MPASKILIQLAVFAALAFPIRGAAALPHPQQVESSSNLVPIAAEQWLPATEESWITFHLALPEKASIREQCLSQEVLAGCCGMAPVNRRVSGRVNGRSDEAMCSEIFRSG